MLKHLQILYRHGWMLLLFCCFHFSAFAQITVSGTVISADDEEALPGVTVIQQGTSNGTVTDFDGKYSIRVPEDATLVFSFVGFTTEEVPVNGRSTINTTLTSDIQSLSEVVVVGYGTQEKRNVTGAIATLDAEAIKKIPVSSAVEAMKGQVAGVDVVSAGGRPGQNPQILIRGRRSISASNDPLYVIDGIPQTSATSSIFDINPQDITSMEVLKDAAATAIYGSRGANGVIIITTKRGSTTGVTTISYDGYYGISSVTNVVDMMNGAEFADLKRESRRRDPVTNQGAWDGVIPADDLVFLDPTELESIAQGRSTDWLDLIIQPGYQTSHQVSVNGGNEKTQFNISLGYFDEEGIIENMDYTRVTARVNLDHKISKVFQVGTSFLTTYANQNWGSGSALGEAVANNPLGVPYDEAGEIKFLPTNDGIRTNPLSELVPGAYVDERRSVRIFAPVYLKANIIEGLTYTLNAGPDIRFNRRGNFRASETNANRGGPANADMENEVDFGYTVENILNYNKSFGIHNLQFTALQSIQGLRHEQQRTAVSNLPYETQLFYDLGSAEVKGDLESRLREWSLSSYMGRVNYDLAGKYLFQATLRADGSSRLAPERKWAYFPGASIGWRVIDEGFMQGIGFMSDLKLRASYGRVGNTSVDPYQTLGRLRRSIYAWGESPGLGFGLNEIPNENLGWEISSTTNFGVDYGFFKNRVSGSVEVYRTNTTDLLLERNLPFTSGYDNILQNIGATRTEGVEFSINAIPIARESFTWSINFNISKYREKITDLVLRDENGNPVDDVGNEWFIGQPINVFYDYEKIGIWQKNEVELAKEVENKVPGEIKLKDQDGDGVITPEDRIILGTDVPEYAGGITNRFQIANFDFSFFFFYRVGHMIRSRFHDSNNGLFGRYNNLDVDYWTIDNPTNSNPRPNENQEFPRDGSTRSYFDGTFVKLRNVTLGYKLPESIVNRFAISSFRIYATAQNPLVWSGFESWDPELAGDINAGSIPSSRLFLLGVNVSF